MCVPGPDGIDKVEAMKHTYHKLNLNCLVILGGNGTHKTANLLREEGLNVITLPKTIDNDLWGTDMTFGFQSAVDIATEAIDRIHTTATSHSRVFIVEVMGHKVGWVTLHAGIAGGADIILLPEIPYDVDNVVRAIKSRTEAGKHFTIIAVAEGAITKEDAALPKKKLKEKQEKPLNVIELAKWGSIALQLGKNDLALSYLNEVSKQLPNLSRVWFNLASILEKEGKLEQASLYRQRGSIMELGVFSKDRSYMPPVEQDINKIINEQYSFLFNLWYNENLKNEIE